MINVYNIQFEDDYENLTTYLRKGLRLTTIIKNYFKERSGIEHIKNLT